MQGNVNVVSGSSLVANTIVPLGNTAGTLGNSTNRWSVVGNTGAFSGALTTSSNLAVNSTKLFVDGGGTTAIVGINTSTPNAVLTVNGTANVSGAAQFSNVVGVSGNLTVGTNVLHVNPTGLVRINTLDVSNTFLTFAVVGNTSITGTQTVSGAVTVGTSTTPSILKVWGDLQVTGNLTSSGTAAGDLIPSTNAYSLGQPTSRWSLYAVTIDASNNVSVGGSLTVTGTGNHTVAGNTNFDSGVLFVDSVNNRVGVGCTTPTSALTVIGNTSISGAALLGNTVSVAGNMTIGGTSHTISGNVNVGSGVLFVDDVNNRVGVGTTTPRTDFVVNGGAEVTGTVTVGTEMFVTGNTRIGSDVSYVLAKADGSLRLTKELEIGPASIYANTSTSPSTAFSGVPIDSFLIADYAAAKLVVAYNSLSNTSVYGATEVLLAHNGATVVLTEYAVVAGVDVGFAVDASIFGGVCDITASSAQGNLVISVARTSLSTGMGSQLMMPPGGSPPIVS